MPKYKFVTWNVKGLGRLLKRKQILDYLNKERADIIFLQETHLLPLDHDRLRSGWVGKVFHSSYATNSRGVAILIRQNVPFMHEETKSDPNGRFIFVRGFLNQTEVVFFNSYCPNYDDPKFINDITLTLSQFNVPIFWGGDFNCILDPKLDRSSHSAYRTSNMSNTLVNNTKDLGLHEIWRAIHPIEKDFSFYSPVHNSYTRIDFFFAPPPFISCITECSYWPRILSDHSALVFTIDFKGPIISPTTWRFNTSLLGNPEFVNSVRHHIDTFSHVHRDSSICPLIIWDCLKAYLRGNIIAFSSTLKKKTKTELDCIEQEIRKLERLHSVSKDPLLLSQMDQLKRKYNTLNTRSTELLILKTKQRYVEQGETAGKLLAWQIKREIEEKTILKIKQIDGNITMDPIKTNQTFKLFYEDLYQSNQSFNQESFNTFLNGTTLPTLSEEEAHKLDSEISVKEIIDAMNTLQNGKSPGLDGFSVEFYRCFFPQLQHFFLSMVKTSLEKAYLPESLRSAVITLIKKKDKDPLLCTSYRPISLLNVDYKIIAKVLSSRLESVASKLINPDQTGFIKGRLSSDNLRRYFNILYHASMLDSPNVVISLDAEKAFDRVEWEYLTSTLSTFNIGPVFIKWIKILYNSPKALIKTNNQLSSPFSLMRGTRQGCPLSPILFASAIELLAAKIRSHSLIKGIQIGEENHIISLYADDILLYLNNPLQSIPMLLTLLDDFGSLSGYKVNWTKTEIMPISHFDSKPLEQHFKWKWSYSSIKYLGINIPCKIENAYTANFPSLIEKVSDDLKRWTSLPISFLGRVNLIKMAILPKFLHLFQNLPIPIPTSFFKKIQSIFISFIWNNKSPRVGIQVLYLPYNAGGLNLPNLKLYYWACQLNQIKQWLSNFSSAWTRIESYDVSPYEIKYIPYFDSAVVKHITGNPMVYNSWKVCRDINRFAKYKDPLSPFTPIWNNPSLPAAFNDNTFKTWHNAGIKEINQLFKNGTFISFNQIQDLYTIPSTHLFRYFQARHMVQSKQQSLTEPKPSKVDSLLRTPLKSLRSISGFYKGLLESLPVNTENTKKKWEHDLLIEISPEDWSDICDKIHNCSYNLRHKLSQFNLIHRVYYTPEKLHRMDSEMSFLCWRCKKQRGTFFHMFWTCSAVSSFWHSVVNRISSCLGISVPYSPRLCLFGTGREDGWNRHQKQYMDLAFLAAKKCITIHWKSSIPPTIAHWLNELSSYTPLDKIYYNIRNKQQDFWHVWQPHMDYFTSPLTVM